MLLWRVHLAHDLGKVVFKVPVSCGSEFLDLSLFLVDVALNKLREAHVASTDSDDQLVVENLGVDFLGAEQVVTKFKTADGHLNIHFVDVLGQQLVHLITSDCLVSQVGLFWFCDLDLLWSLLTNLLFESSDEHILISKDIFERL